MIVYAASRRGQFEPDSLVIVVTPLGPPDSFLRCESSICNDTERVREVTTQYAPGHALSAGIARRNDQLP